MRAASPTLESDSDAPAMSTRRSRRSLLIPTAIVAALHAYIGARLLPPLPLRAVWPATGRTG